MGTKNTSSFLETCLNDTSCIADISQATMAICASLGVWYAAREYRKLKRNKKVDLAVRAIESWERSVTHLTGAAFALLREDDEKRVIARLIMSNQPIKIKRTDEAKSYNFLMDGDGIIPADKVNDIRYAIISYLNAWEVLAVLYREEIADREILRTLLMDSKFLERLTKTLNPYMELCDNAQRLGSKRAWAPVRELWQELMSKPS